MTIKDQSLELKRLRRDGGTSDVRALQEELIELEKKYDGAVRDLDSLEESLESERQTAALIQASANEEKQKLRNLEDGNKRLEAECRELKLQLQSQRGRLQNRQSDDEQHRALLNQKNVEMNRYIEEVQMLSTENAQLSLEMEEVTVELEVAMQEMDKVQGEFDGAQKALQDAELRVEELVDERDALRIRVEDLSDQLDSVQREKHTSVIMLETQIFSLTTQLRQEDDKNQNLEETVERLKTTIKKLRSNDDQMVMDELKNELQQKDVIIDQLKTKLNDLQTDFKLLAQDWDRTEQLASKKRETAPVTPTTDADKLQEKFSILKLRRKEDSEKIKQLLTEIAQKEKEVVKLEQKIQKFESGAFGLKDALDEIKLLKAKNMIHEKDLLVHVNTINDLEAQAEDLVTENTAMREQLGFKFTDIDLNNFKNMKLVELEKAKSLILTLKAEIDKLEDERIQLKARVRLQALDRGERAIELGLDAADLMAVEDYAEKLRAGGIATGQVTASRPSLPQLDGLLGQLERNYIEHTETRDKLQNTEERLKQALGELQVFESALMEMSRNFIDSRDQLSDVSKVMPHIELLIALLQNKQVSHNNPKIKQAFIEVEESLSKTNSQMKKEVVHLTAQLNRQKTESEHFRTLADSLRNENLKLKMELENDHDQVRRPRTAIEIDTSKFGGQSSVGFSNVLEQLVDALVVLEEQEQELSLNRSLLQEYKEKLQPLVIRTRLLYKQYTVERQDHQARNKQLVSKLENSEHERATLTKRLELLENALDLVKQDPDTLKSLYIDIQRKYVVLEVQTMGLARRHETMLTTEKFLNQENAKLKQDLLEMDQIARQTIARLVKRDKDFKYKIEQLLQLNQDSISLTEYRILENKLRIFTEKTRLLTERERDRTNMVLDYEREGRIIQELEEKNHILELAILEHQEKAKAFESYVANVTANGDYLADSYWRPKNENLKIQIQVLEKRAQIAEEKASHALSMQNTMKQQLDTIDKLYIESKEETIQLQERHLELLNVYEGGVTREEHTTLKKEISTLQEQVEKLKTTIEYEKNLTETANSQAFHLQSQLKQDQAERDLLRAAVKELQMMDDEKMLIGKLHQHILNLQKQELRARDQVKQIETKCIRLEKIVVQQENHISTQDQFIFDLRMKSKKQLQYLHKTLAHMQSKLSGCVLFERHERACQMNTRLNDLRKKMQERSLVLEQERNQLQDDLILLNQKYTLEKELENIIKNPTASQQRILQWHKRLVEAESKASLAERKLERLKEVNSVNEANAQFHQQKVEELHDQLLLEQNEHDMQQLTWEQQQTEFEKMIAQYEEERDRLYLSTTAGELKDSLPDRSLPVGEQLEQALRKIIERTRQINFLKIRNEELEAKVKSQLESIQQTNQVLNDTTHRMKKMELESGRNATIVPESEDVVPVKDDLHSDRSRIREANALRAAHESMVSLQKQLKQKNELVEKYREMVRKVRDELTTKTLQNESISQKNRELQQVLQRELERFQKSEHEKNNSTEREIVVEVEMIEELQKLLQVKEVLVGELEEKLQSALESGTNEKERLEKLNTQLQGELDTLQRDLEAAKATEEYLREEVEKAKDLLAVPPVKDLSDVVHRLHGEIETKDSKISNLNKAIQKLKTQLVLISKELAESKIHSNSDTVYTEEKVQQKILPLTKKITQLESKLKKVTEGTEKERIEYLHFEQDMQRMTDELLLKNKEVAKLKAEVQEMLAKMNGDNSAVEPGLVRTTSWENEKSTAKKMDQLKQKLKQKIQEADSLENDLIYSKEAYERSEKDRLKLQNRIKKLSKEFAEKEELKDAELKQLQKQLQSLQITLSKGRGSKSSEQLQVPALPSSLTDFDVHTLAAKSNNELIEIVGRLATRIGKQNSVNVPNQLKKDLEVQKKLVGELQDQIQNYKKLESENTSLRQSLRKESEKVKSLHSRLEETKLANDTMIKEIVQLRKIVSKPDEAGDSIEQLTLELSNLKAQLSEKEKIILELSNPDVDETARIQSENRKFKREIETLQLRIGKLTNETTKSSHSYQTELDQLKNEHSKCKQEIEDLKYNYKEALKQNVFLESRIK